MSTRHVVVGNEEAVICPSWSLHMGGDGQLAPLAAGLTPNKARNFPGPKSWEQGALFVGLTKLADRSDEPQFR